VLVNKQLDTPWAIIGLPERKLVSILRGSGYKRYQYVAAKGLRLCMDRIIKEYDGSLYLMLENSLDEEEFSKRLQELYGVGPKISEIFMRETEEIFASRIE